MGFLQHLLLRPPNGAIAGQIIATDGGALTATDGGALVTS